MPAWATVPVSLETIRGEVPADLLWLTGHEVECLDGHRQLLAVAFPHRHPEGLSAGVSLWLRAADVARLVWPEGSAAAVRCEAVEEKSA